MGTIQTLVPNAVVSGGGSWTASAGTIVACLSDGSDTTYVTKTGSAVLYLDLTTYTIAAGYRLNRVRAGVKVYCPTPGAKQYRIGWQAPSPYPSFGIAGVTAYTSPGSNVWRYTSWISAAQMVTLPQFAIDGMQCYINDGGSAGTMRFTEVALYLDVIDQPTVSVTTPATNTSRPVVSWTYSDGDGDPQSGWWIRVFDSATYGAGGFDPAVSTPVWESFGNDNSSSAQTGSLSNGTYRAYVRVQHDAATPPAYLSAWAYAQWTVAVTPPTLPSLSLSWVPASASVSITATGAALPGGYTNQTFHLQASSDGGTTWYDVRGALAAVPNGSYKVITNDYEIARGITAKYRVQASALDGSGLTVTSAWSSPTNVTTVNDGTWWLSVPANPALYLGSVPIEYDADISIDETLGMFRPLGATKATVVAGDEYGEDGTFVIHAQAAQAGAISALAKVTTPILAQDPWGGQKYIRWTDRGRVIAGTVAAPRSLWTLPYVEVARPPVLS